MSQNDVVSDVTKKIILIILEKSSHMVCVNFDSGGFTC